MSYPDNELPSGLDAITAAELIEGGLLVVQKFGENKLSGLSTDEIPALITAGFNSKIDGFGLWGSGIDDNITLTGDVTLTKDVQYQIVTPTTDLTIHKNGFKFYAWEVAPGGAVTIEDKGSDANNNNASATLGGTPGSVRSAGYLPAPTVGVAGGNANTNGNPGTNILNALGLSGIAGNNSATKTGGIAGVATTLAAVYGGMRNFVNLQLWRAFGVSSLLSPLINAGNGSGAGGNSAGGGASGNNGGYVMAFIRKVSGTVILDASGGKGGDGYNLIGGAGPGGNGGVIGFIYHLITGSVTYKYSGGVGGNGYGGQANTGIDGILIALQL